MNDIQELDLGQMNEVGGGVVSRILRGWGAGKLLDLAWDALRDHNESGAAADFQTGTGSGAGTFG
jgi:hypothetical protein